MRSVLKKRHLLRRRPSRRSCISVLVVVTVLLLGCFALRGMVSGVVSTYHSPGGSLTKTQPEAAAVRKRAPTTTTTPSPLAGWKPNPTGNEINGKPYHPLDYLHSAVSRPDEVFISVENYVSCLERVLLVSTETQKEMPFPPDGNSTTIPVLAVPYSVDMRDVKGFACSLEFNVRHLIYTHNEQVDDVAELFSEIQKRFSFTKRLEIITFTRPRSLYAGANIAFEYALSRPAEEVPFVLVASNDVRIFGKSISAPFVRQMYDTLSADLPVLQRLAAEVSADAADDLRRYGATSPLPPTRLHAPYSHENFGTRRLTVVTSALLPARIRSLPKEEMKRAFEGRPGLFFFTSKRDPSLFAVTRLAIATVGYIDENHFPTYLDDFDFRRRSRTLGFTEIYQEELAVCFNDAIFGMLDVSNDNKAGDGAAEQRFLTAFASKSAEKLRSIVSRAFSLGLSFRYTQTKWALKSFGDNLVLDGFPAPFRDVPEEGRPPVDAWVYDARRVNYIYHHLLDRSAPQQSLTLKKTDYEKAYVEHPRG